MGGRSRAANNYALRHFVSLILLRYLYFRCPDDLGFSSSCRLPSMPIKDDLFWMTLFLFVFYLKSLRTRYPRLMSGDLIGTRPLRVILLNMQQISKRAYKSRLTDSRGESRRDTRRCSEKCSAHRCSAHAATPQEAEIIRLYLSFCFLRHDSPRVMNGLTGYGWEVAGRKQLRITAFRITYPSSIPILPVPG